ncbi:hypothetical protein COY24_03685 [Candidatus Uhrbacteria bacterium CG_4_10_14_0_2_um_filter_41_21]|nr:MAG: hypothetical protein COY24_03685 [Candidatus Uhrbacteria bacterium CG_4_10_14_0_2_um_filter_41_21]
MKLAGKKILLVEDDNFIGDMFIRKLTVEGALCTRAMSGADGLRKLAEAHNDFDIIITDVMMAEMDGYEMITKIKADVEAKLIPIIVLTNRSSLTEETKKVVHLDIAGLFIKSNTSLSELTNKVAEIIERNPRIKNDII